MTKKERRLKKKRMDEKDQRRRRRILKEGLQIELKMEDFLNDDPTLLKLRVTRNGSHWLGFPIFEEELPKLLRVIKRHMRRGNK